MPLPFLSVPAFPNVPNVPGVPALNRIPNSLLSAKFAGVGGLPLNIGILIAKANSPTGLIQQDAPNLPQPAAASVWGLFDPTSGIAIVEQDSTVSFEFRNESRVPNYPQELGGFNSYNKTASPFGIRMRMSKGGSTEERTTFLNAFSDKLSSLDFVSAITPEVTYTSAQVVGYDYKREQRNGANYLVIEALIQEIRITATQTFTNTKQISGQDPAGPKPVQATAVPVTSPPIVTN